MLFRSPGSVSTAAGQSAVQVQTSTRSFAAGTHKLSICYLERGASQSNCSIYFNVAPRYSLEIAKQDAQSATALNGASFSVYMDSDATGPAPLWQSLSAYQSGAAATNTFSAENGIASCWGLAAGRTYYIKETTPPPGYPPVLQKTICLVLDSKEIGRASCRERVLRLV